MESNEPEPSQGLFLAWLAAWTIIPFGVVPALEAFDSVKAGWIMGAGVLLFGGWASWMVATGDGAATKSSLPKAIAWASLYFVGGLFIAVACGCAGCVMVGLKRL